MTETRLAQVYLRISPGKFHFLKFILEGYDNLAILSSYSGVEGVVVVRYSEAMTKDFFCLIASIASDLSEPL